MEGGCILVKLAHRGSVVLGYYHICLESWESGIGSRESGIGEFGFHLAARVI